MKLTCTDRELNLSHPIQFSTLPIELTRQPYVIIVVYCRMWELENEENYILHLDGHSGYDPNENITCLAFSEKKG
jgi:hypothetical protein